MKFPFVATCLFALSFGGLTEVASARCGAPPKQRMCQPRQFHSHWTWHPKHEYYYCKYYFKAEATNCTYQCHFCVYYPKYPNVCFYYNPAKDKFWGCFWYDAEPDHNFYKHSGNEKPTMGQLVGFGDKAHKMPDILGSTDGTAMERPPGTPR